METVLVYLISVSAGFSSTLHGLGVAALIAAGLLGILALAMWTDEKDKELLPRVLGAFLSCLAAGILFVMVAAAIPMVDDWKAAKELVEAKCD